MKLDGGDLYVNFRQAMVDSLENILDMQDLLLAYPIEKRLERVIPDDPELIQIIRGANHLLTEYKKNYICSRVIDYFNQQDKIEDLISAYYKKSATHQDFLKVYKFANVLASTYSISSEGNREKISSFGSLEAKIRGNTIGLDVEILVKNASHIRSKVCCIIDDSSSGSVQKKARGTGFLVGEDLVLTNYHVLNTLIENKENEPNLKNSFKFVFDYYSSDQKINELPVFKLAKGWLVAFSPVHNDDTIESQKIPNIPDTHLDYALVRLDSQVSNTKSIHDGTKKRDFIDLNKTSVSDFKTDSSLMIFQHSDGDPLVFAYDPKSIIGINQDRTRVRYKTNSFYGSSGSPCYDENFNLVALHNSGVKRKYNQGIPIDKICEDIKKKANTELLKIVFESSEGHTDEKRLKEEPEKTPKEKPCLDESSQKITEKIIKLVKKEVTKILEKEELKPLKESLINQIKKNHSSTNSAISPVKALIECNKLREALLRILNPAVTESLEENKGSLEKTELIWHGALDIFGWLVLLSVDYGWISRKDLVGKDLKSMKLEIPAEKDACVEIVLSGITESQAKLDIDIKKDEPIGAMGGKFVPERGWEEKDHILTIKQIIWKIVFKKDPPQEFRSFENKQLDATLSFRNDGKEYHYLIVDGSDVDHPLNTQSVYTELKKDLPNSNVVFMSFNENESALLVDEPELYVYVNEFFRNRPEYKNA